MIGFFKTSNTTPSKCHCFALPETLLSIRQMFWTAPALWRFVGDFETPT